MASGVRLKATQMTGRPITWAQLNLEAAEDLRGLMRRNRWAAELMLTLITRMEPGGAGVVVCSRETMRELLGCNADCRACSPCDRRRRLGATYPYRRGARTCDKQPCGLGWPPW